MKKLIFIILLACMSVFAQAQCSVSVTASNDSLTCVLTSSTLTTNVTSGTAPYTYQWSTGSVNSTTFVSNTGVFTVTITDALGCTATASKIITTDFSIPSITINTPPNPSITCNQTCVALEIVPLAPANFQWSTGETDLSIMVCSDRLCE